jgi:hypothetical protein
MATVAVQFEASPRQAYGRLVLVFKSFIIPGSQPLVKMMPLKYRLQIVLQRINRSISPKEQLVDTEFGIKKWLSLRIGTASNDCLPYENLRIFFKL